ncbi:MAG TPA: DNA topoisomerase, partial [Chroococcales cyanobacterium]
YPTKKGAQDAHEAIRPSSVVRTPESMKPFLTPDQNKLYRLIWERFLASQMANAVIKVMSIEIDAKNEEFSALLRSADSKVVFPGFQAVYTEVTDEEEVEKKSKLPELTAGETLKLKEVLPKQHFTQAPPRFTEASLVKTLEEKGIGRPSTYAPTISTIIDRGYVEREAKTLKPTELGLQVNEQLVQHFPTIVDVGFTADLEDKLDAVEAGEQEWQKLIAAFYKPFQETLKIAAKEMKPVAIPSGEYCETCGQPLLIKTGRFGEFLACSGYPECKTTKPLIKKLGVTCRAPGCTGDIIIKRSRTGKTFYACSRYPECTFTSWDPPTEQACPKCSSFMVQKRATKTGRAFLLCSNVECKNILNLKPAKKEEEAEAVEK